MIGTVRDVETFRYAEHDELLVVTVGAFQVEAAIYGQTKGWIHVLTIGGEMDGKRHGASAYPEFRLDQRYILALRQRAGRPYLIMGNGTGAIRLSPTASLPSEDYLQLLWSGFCDVAAD